MPAGLSGWRTACPHHPCTTLSARVSKGTSPAFRSPSKLGRPRARSGRNWPKTSQSRCWARVGRLRANSGRNRPQLAQRRCWSLAKICRNWPISAQLRSKPGPNPLGSGQNSADFGGRCPRLGRFRPEVDRRRPKFGRVRPRLEHLRASSDKRAEISARPRVSGASNKYSDRRISCAVADVASSTLGERCSGSRHYRPALDRAHLRDSGGLNNYNDRSITVFAAVAGTKLGESCSGSQPRFDQH